MQHRLQNERLRWDADGFELVVLNAIEEINGLVVILRGRRIGNDPGGAEGGHGRAAVVIPVGIGDPADPEAQGGARRGLPNVKMFVGGEIHQIVAIRLEQNVVVVAHEMDVRCVAIAKRREDLVIVISGHACLPSVGLTLLDPVDAARCSSSAAASRPASSARRGIL